MGLDPTLQWVSVSLRFCIAFATHVQTDTLDGRDEMPFVDRLDFSAPPFLAYLPTLPCRPWPSGAHESAPCVQHDGMLPHTCRCARCPRLFASILFVATRPVSPWPAVVMVWSPASSRPTPPSLKFATPPIAISTTTLPYLLPRYRIKLHS
ncbi:hypothetical protein LX32DRAFT_112700 [Colletotrichum zoysiae]|uniref:Secreted protein n=1 Tax=Colletotrichum zoysiae TaxID=1216348 RepID=A0AAD9LZQ2_9PEZI|nr:hypothetical protein LX32DRAFT_112700 [Colletotrichum zoysiae]